jgi:hypothetical protein
MCHTRTGRSSTRAATIRSPSGDHQNPRRRSISSAAANSATPQCTSGSGSDASSRSSDPSAPTTRREPSDTYAIRAPAGSGRGSNGSGTPTSILRAPPSSRSARNRWPSIANADTVSARSAAWSVTPVSDSRRRSRRSRSSADRCSSSPVAGSNTSRSSPVATSSTQRHPTGSSPDRDRRKATRAPSSATANVRGRPRLNRRVRAYWRGKDSVGNGSSVTGRLLEVGSGDRPVTAGRDRGMVRAQDRCARGGEGGTWMTSGPTASS